MAKKPYEDTKLAKYVSQRILQLRPKKSQLQIASEAGFPSPNMITMIKQGASKLALDRVPSMARALEADPAYLMRLALEQAVSEESAAAIVETFGTPVSQNELGWLQVIRDASDDTDPRITTRWAASIKGLFGK